MAPKVRPEARISTLCCATIRFSSTVMPWNSRMFWKVRATRARALMSWSSSRSRRKISPVGLAQLDHALGRLVEAGDAVEHRGLARAVRADQGGDVVPARLEGDVVDGGEPAEAHGEVLDLEQRVLLPRPHARPSSTSGAADRPRLIEHDRGRARADDAARAPDHDPDHGDAEQQHAVERGIEALAENALQPSVWRSASKPPTMTMAAMRHAELAAHAAQNDDGEDDGRLDEGETLRADEALAGGEEAAGQPPNIAPMAKAVSLVMVVLMPSERQAIWSSRNASQARPMGSRRNLQGHEIGDEEQARGSRNRGR